MTPGRKVAVAVSVGRAIGVGLRVRDGAAIGNWLLVIGWSCGVEVGMDCVGIAGVGERDVVSAAQDTNKIQSNRSLSCFIDLSITIKN